MDKVAREIIEAIEEKSPNESTRELLLQHLNKSITNVKFLLVLDDVWDKEGRKWVDLRNCLEGGMVGSRVLVTTRNEKVAKVMGTTTTNLHHLEKLSDEACWDLFSQITFSYDEEKKDDKKLQKIAREIVSKCKGLPLAVRTLGNVLRFKDTIEEWEHVSHSEIWKIEDVDVELFPHLYLSYNELAPPIKRCFSYCSIFPKDTKMDVDEIIRMWMAQGYVTSTNGEDDMDLKGKRYFIKLATSCFFQEFEKDIFGNIVHCKMHDIVHDFAQYLTINEITIIANERQNSFPQKPHRHVNWLSSDIDSRPIKEEGSPLTIRDGVGNLRSIFIQNYSLQQPGALIKHLKCVRSLVLDKCFLENLPKEIGSLVHLRLLDLSSNYHLNELPESICELYNLQTLNISYCFDLKILPEAIGKLINLRHLLNMGSGLEEYPKSLEKLTSLRTLSVFKVGRKRGKLEYLKDLKHLRGALVIEIDCSDLDVREMVSDAHKSQINNNKHIKDLWINFVDNSEGGVHEAVLEALLPPHSLTRLYIDQFKGRQYPKWLTNSSPLNNLRWLTICWGLSRRNCSILPPLWKLPYLESLNLENNNNIKRIGLEFLGIEESSFNLGNSRLCAAAPKLPSLSTVLIAFPMLVELTFNGFGEWKEWEDLNEEYTVEPSTSSSSIQIMPRLKKLRLLYCYKFQQLPHRLLRKASSLEYMEIYHCGFSKINCQKQVEQLLSHTANIKVDERVHSR